MGNPSEGRRESGETPAKVTAQMGASLAGPNTMAADLVGPAGHLQIVLAIRHHHEVISVQLVRETMMGQEEHARYRLPNVRSQGVDEQIEKQRGENSPLSDPTVSPWSGEKCTTSNLRLSVTEEMAHEMPHLPCHPHLMKADHSAFNPRCVKRSLEVHESNECVSRSA